MLIQKFWKLLRVSCWFKNKKIVYILGNHDAELIFESLRNHLVQLFPEKVRDKLIILYEQNKEYRPVKEVALLHGHDYEFAHTFHHEESFYVSEEQKKYFIPPWGSYYVTRVINKFKEERGYVNQVRPIKFFLIRGLIYDTLFTLRFIFSTCFYFFMVRFLYFIKHTRNFKKLYMNIEHELKLFYDLEEKSQNYFQNNREVEVLIVGHTHDAFTQTYPTGGTVINTGTWTNMHFLNMGKNRQGTLLTFAQVDICGSKNIEAVLNVWKGKNELPYEECFNYFPPSA